MQYQRSLFIFRRDIRLEDNIGLLAACAESERVLPVFIFDPAQQAGQNDYFSPPAFQFLLEALADLHKRLKSKGGYLQIYQGDPVKVLKSIISQHQINAVYVNRDYTPFATKRDEAIQNLCLKKEVDFHSWHDVSLYPPGSICTESGGAYKVFTSFKKTALTKEVSRPQVNNYRNFFTTKTSGSEGIAYLAKLLPTSKRKVLAQKGQRAAALDVLAHLADFQNYDEDKNFPYKDATTHLSAHHKFGTISVRETFWSFVDTFGKNHGVINELLWREFYLHLLATHPRLLKEPMQRKYKEIQWKNNKEHFHAWCEGRTGFPVIDAAMRQLNTTGWMHNRLRMTVASFLTKDLHIDWRWGEKYFAQHLVDYDPASNNGGWQWAASTGADAQPYFRIFNPWTQQSKFDPHAHFIKRFIPELKTVAAKDLHAIARQPLPAEINYPQPIVNHSEARQETLKLYKQISS